MGLSAIDIVYMADFALSYERFRNMIQRQNCLTRYDEKWHIVWYYPYGCFFSAAIIFEACYSGPHIIIHSSVLVFLKPTKYNESELHRSDI